MFPPVFSTLSAASAVTALIGDPPRAWRHGNAPQGGTQPYVTWFAGATPENTLSELPAVDRVGLQVDCWSADDAEVEALAIAVRDAIEPLAQMTTAPVDDFEPQTKLYRVTLQFDWWLARPA